MTLLLFLAIILAILVFIACFFKGTLKPNEKKSFAFKFLGFSLIIDHEKGDDNPGPDPDL